MNRSLYRNTLAASMATWDRERWIGGVVDLVAVFPAGAFDVRLADGSRPVGPGLWWLPDDPKRPWVQCGTATAAYIYGDEPQVWTLLVRPDREPDIYTLRDKIHRVRWGARGEPHLNVATPGDPDRYRELTIDFDLIEQRYGFLPYMHEWIYPGALYGDHYYLAVEYDPWSFAVREAGGLSWCTAPPFVGSGLRETVAVMDMMRCELGARVLMYPERRHGRGFRRTSPAWYGHNARDFLADYREWRQGGGHAQTKERGHETADHELARTSATATDRSTG